MKLAKSCSVLLRDVIEDSCCSQIWTNMSKLQSLLHYRFVVLKLQGWAQWYGDAGNKPEGTLYFPAKMYSKWEEYVTITIK